MSHTVAVSLTDAELLDQLFDGPRMPAAEELKRRHGRTTADYARLLAADEPRALELLKDAFDHALATRWPGNGSWGPVLAAAVRLVAARWADGGREHDLSPDFRHWLTERRRGSRHFTSVLADAEAAAPLLQAIRGLPAALSDEVWQALCPPDRASPQAAGSPRQVPPAPAPPVRAALHAGYLRKHSAQVPDRSCRHLVARLGHTVEHRTPADPQVERHLAACTTCARAHSELLAIREWQPGLLRSGVLLGTAPAPDSADSGRSRDRADTRPVPDAADGSARRTTADVPGAGACLGAFEVNRSPQGRRRHRAARTTRRTAALAGVGLVVLGAGLGALTGPGAPPDTIGLPRPTPSGSTDEPSPPASTRPDPGPTPTSHPSPTPTRTRTATGASASPKVVPRTSSPTPRVAPAPVGPAEPTEEPVDPLPSPTPTPTPEPQRILRLGDSGQDVARLQHLLRAVGCTRYPVPAASGRFDNTTWNALIRFQEENRLKGDIGWGVYGPRTRTLLERKAAAASCGSTRAPEASPR
ncbi:peptidoglycan-binding protein [Kitasatospora sp. NPDC054939]